MSDRQDTHEDAEVVPQPTDPGEGERGTSGGREHGTFAPTPGEAGDRPEAGPPGPDTPIPHKQP